MKYRVTIDETVHATINQRRLAEKFLRELASGPVSSSPASRLHSSDSRFHGEITAEFDDLDRAKLALKRIGELNLRDWVGSYQLEEALSGNPISLTSDEIEEINAPLTLETRNYRKSPSGELSRNELRDKLMVRQKYRCYVCGITKADYDKIDGNSFDIHRIFPGRRGGEYTEDNCILVCRPCHDQIRELTLDEVNLLRDRRQGY